MGDQGRGETATLSVALLSGIVDPLKFGGRVYVEVRLVDQIRRLSPVSVHPDTGSFSYEGLNGARFNDKTLEDIFDDHLFIVLRSWSSALSDWIDAAQIVVPVRTIDIAFCEEREFRSFVLESITEEFVSADEDKPCLVLSATVKSPFRPPVETVARLLEGYASTVDRAIDVVSQQTERVTPFLTSRAALVPAIPIGVFALASLPLVVVIGVAGLPLLVPILVVVAAVGAAGTLLAGAVWAFSRGGRPWVQRVIQPVYDKVGRENPEVLYPVGPSPSPARVVRSLVPTTMWPKLALSVCVDFVGCTSYAVPLLGESADLLWAPLSYLLIDAMYRESSPWAGLFGAMEEILPFTDIIPTASLAWLKEYIPLMVQQGHATAAAGTQQQQQRQQRQQQQGRVYHSNGDVSAGGVQYPTQSDD